MNFCDFFLYHVDFFKSPFYFSVNSDQTKISSKWGSFYSLVIISVLFYFFVSSPMITKMNPAIMSQNIPQKVRSDITLINSEFNLAFGVYDRFLKGYPIDESIFSLVITFTKIQINSENDMPFINSHAKMFPCKGSQLFTYCFEDFNFTLRGYLDDNSAMIRLSLYLCNNDTSNNTCQSLETIRNFLTDKVFALSYMDHTLDLNNYEEPVQKYYKSEYFSLDVNNYKNMAIYFKKVDIYEDDNIFYYQNHLKRTTFVKDYINNDFSHVDLSNLKNPLAEFTLFSSENLCQIQRSYQKLGQMLAFLSGIYSLLKIMGASIINLRVRYVIQNKIMRFLYDLDFSHLKKTRLQFKSDKSLKPNQKQSNQKHQKPSYIEQLWFKFKMDFNMMLLFFFHKNYQEEYLNLINLKTILKGLHDLQKLKIILFDNYQLKLFDQMKRPKISFSSQNEKKSCCDSGKKLMNLMQMSPRFVNFQNELVGSKNLEEKIPKTIEEKLKFFNI